MMRIPNFTTPTAGRTERQANMSLLGLQWAEEAQRPAHRLMYTFWACGAAIGGIATSVVLYTPWVG